MTIRSIGFPAGARQVCVTVAVLTMTLGLTGCSDDDDRKQKAGTSGANGSAQKQNQPASGGNGNSKPVSTAIHFADVTESSGIDFTYGNGQEAGVVAIVESLGGGVGLIDYDDDGRPDVILPGGGVFPTKESIGGLPSALYRNLGDLKFEPVTEPAGVGTVRHYTHGAAVGDYDNDGFDDFVITGYGGVVLYHNMGDGTFEETTLEAKLLDDQWSSSASWGDLDGDGNLDLFVVHYVNWSFENHPWCNGRTEQERDICPPRHFDGLRDIVYLGNGDGTFRDVSDEWGIKEGGKGLGVVIGDFDLDGDLDVYVGNDTVANFLYRNQGDKFKDTSLMSGTSLSHRGTPDGSMGVDMGDFNRDGLPDLWVANYESESFALYRNEGNCIFQPVSPAHGITAVGSLYVGWGTAFLDADLDGDLDVFCSNGHVIRFPDNAPLRQNPLLFENHDGDRFIDVASAAGSYTSSVHMGRGLAIGDLDGDGDIDVVVTHTNEPVSVLSNETNTDSWWIGFDLVGRTSSRTPIGARVTLQFKDGETWTSQLKGGSSYASSSDPTVMFGLGKRSLKSVRLHWPSGISQEVESPVIGQVMTIIEADPDTEAEEKS